MFAYPIHFLIGFAISFLPVLNVLAKAPPSFPEEPQIVREEVVAVVLETEAPTAGEEPTVLAAAAEEQVAETPTLAPTPTPSPEPAETPVPTTTPKPTVEPTIALTETPEPAETPVAVAAAAAPTPIPVPTATPDVFAHPPYDGWIAQYANEYGIDRNLLDRIAQCESQFNPSIVSPNGKYIGLFQFSAGTWQNYRAKMGLDTNPDLRLNPEESIKTAAYVVSIRGTAPWPSCLR